MVGKRTLESDMSMRWFENELWMNLDGLVT